VNLARVSAGQLRLTYPVTAGFNYTIEFRNNLTTGGWQTLTGGPHNSGDVIVNNSSGAVFYRVGAAPQ
jgi:hypothetical protein